MKKKYRYEFYLPLRYNNGKVIEKDKFERIKRMISDEFDGVSVHYIKILGEWKDPVTGRIFKDDNLKYEVTVDEKEEKFFSKLKDTMKSMFGQKDIYMIRTLIESL